MPNRQKWSDEAWQAAAHYYDAILDHPFIKGLIDGSLPYDRFIAYLRQDEMYIRHYSRVLAHIASRSTSTAITEAFLNFAMDGVAVEKAMHQSYLADCPDGVEMTPSCRLYTSVLSSTAAGPLAVEAASILPCFWVYQAVGQHILKAAGALDSNPYRRWIETYSDPVFTESNRRAIDICDNLADEATDEVRRRMTDMFVLCTRLEWMFWNSAYINEQWPV